jgi:hypothetical protein
VIDLAWQVVAVLYPAYVEEALGPLALMNSAEEGLISLMDCKSKRTCRLTSSRSDLFCHHECFTRATLSGWFLLLSVYIAEAGKALLQLRSKLRP